MKLSPLHDWAVIRPSDAEEMTKSGLYIPDTAKDKPYEGVVLSIGPGAYEEEKDRKKKEEKKERRFIPATIKPGDRVLYERYAGQTYTIDGEELVLVREREILGVLPARMENTREKLKPLQIPVVTSLQQATTSIVRRPTFPIAKTPDSTQIQKPTKKVKKKTITTASAKKTAKKIAEKTKKHSKSGSSKSNKAKKKK
jgi:chaperonin GroES